MRIRSRLLLSFGIVLLIIVAGGAVSFVQINRLNEAGRQLGVVNARNLEAAMQVSHAVAESHLWLEEVLFGAEEIDEMATVEDRIQEAHWYLEAMLNGGSNERNTFFAISEDKRRLRQQVAAAEAAIQNYHDLAIVRFESFQESGTFSRTLDDQFDRAYEQLVTRMNLLQDALKEDMRASEATMTDVALTGRLVIAGSTLIGLIIAVILALIVSGQFARRINRIADFSGEVATGDFSQRIEQRSTDEIGEMADSLDEIVRSLGGTLQQVKETGLELNETGQDLATNMEQTASSVNQISAHIEGIQRLILNQAASVEESSSSIEEVVRNIDSLNNLITNQSSSVNESSAAVEQMVGNIHSISRNIDKMEERFQALRTAAGSGREMLNRTDETVQQISQQSEALLDTNKVISGIAAQTNLLAMNAAIEAAHAGDAGRGFAVVAAEIRSLAEDTAKKSKDVDTFLKELKGQIETMVDSSKKSQLSFGEVEESIRSVGEISTEVKQSMEEQASGSSEVLQALTEINSITQEVKNGSDEMKSGSQTVLEEMARLSGNSEEVKQSITEILQGIEEINGAVHHVSDISGKNRALATSLGERISRFRLAERSGDEPFQEETAQPELEEPLPPATDSDEMA